MLPPKFLSEELISTNFRASLINDFSTANVCRFLVAYVSEQGLASLGHRLSVALRTSESFGVSSLSCICGYQPLVRLQAQLSDGEHAVRLKYFMDPLVRDTDEAERVTLFHSKLIFLVTEGGAKSVVYVGSHNWTLRALGPDGPRNAEASIRFEMPFSSDHLTGSGPSLAAEVNRHLLEAWRHPLCLPAVRGNVRTFEEWSQAGCRNRRSGSLDDTVVILAVRDRSGARAFSGIEWTALERGGIYLQCLVEDEGDMVWEGGDQVLILVWESQADLQAARQPVLLKCRVTSRKAGPTSLMRGSNSAPAPMEGFGAVLWDRAQAAALHRGDSQARSPGRALTGREVGLFDFDLPGFSTSCGAIDAGLQPRYQYYLEVDRVVLPDDERYHGEANFVWRRETFAVAEDRRSAKIETVSGFCVDPETESRMLESLEQFGVDRRQARVLPTSARPDERQGKRISKHAIHETFIDAETLQASSQFYEGAQPGAMVADLPDRADRAPFNDDFAFLEPIPRVARVCTMPWRELEALWAACARNRRERGGKGE
jgi:hypothetical protein